MSYDDYKWKKRKYYIRINCWIIIAILTAILCFMFPIISNAEGTPTPAPSSAPTPIPSSAPAPDGYYWFDECLPVGEEYLYTDTTVDVSAIPDTYYNPITNDLDLLYFDHDLTNGEILIEQDSWNHVYNWYEPVYNNNGSVSWVYGDGYISDLSNYVLNTDGRLYLFDSNYKEATFTSSSFGIYDLGPNDDSVEASAKYRHHYVMSWLSLSGYNNVYYFKHGGSAYTVGYPSSVGIGTYQADTPHYSEILYYYKPYGVAHVFMSNFNNIYCISESLRGGASVYITDSDNNRESQIYGPPHHQILNNYRVEEEEITYPDGSGGDDSNNLYMRTADWQFNIPKYWGNVTSEAVQPSYESAWGSGTILYYGLLNDYQKANSGNFTLQFKFHIWCSGHYFSDVESSINGNFYGAFDYNDSVTLDNFILNNNTITFSVDDLFEHAKNNQNLSFNDFLDSQVKGHNSINNWNWYITCDAALVSGVGSSGHLVEKYNFISQVSQEQSNTITDNNNPYIPSDDSGYSPDLDNTNSPSTNDGYSKNGINITNNPVITITNTNNNNSSAMSQVNNSDGNPFNTLINKLFGDGTVQEGSIGGTTQDQLLTTTGASRWLAVMGDSMSWVPASLWLEIQLFLFITLGILVVAFILRIVLDFL